MHTVARHPIPCSLMNELIGLVIFLSLVAWLIDTITANPALWITGAVIVAVVVVIVVVRQIVNDIRARRTVQNWELSWEPVVRPYERVTATASTSTPHVFKPQPATSRTPGLLAELRGKQATITYRDIADNETHRRIAVWYLTGRRERAGDVLTGIEAWCHLREGERTFYISSIHTESG